MTAPPTEPRDPSPSAERGYADLGLGRVVVQSARGRFLTHDGRPTGRRYGLGAQRVERFYLNALYAGWPEFLGWGLGVLLLCNGIFALAYLALGPGAILGAEATASADPFVRALSFSVGIFTTTGTAPMYAAAPTAQWLVVLESFVGPTLLVTAGGLLVARLTRPRMRIRFSDSMVVAPYEGGRGLMFRMVNAQPGDLSDVRVRVSLSWLEDFDGKRERDIHPLALERNSVEFFTLHWTVVHPITADSPLAGITPEALREAEPELLVLVDAHEETFSTRVTARASYVWEEITWDARFASIFTSSSDGLTAIDVDRLSRLERLPPGTTTTPGDGEGRGGNRGPGTAVR